MAMRDVALQLMATLSIGDVTWDKSGPAYGTPGASWMKDLIMRAGQRVQAIFFGLRPSNRLSLRKRRQEQCDEPEPKRRSQIRTSEELQLSPTVAAARLRD